MTRRLLTRIAIGLAVIVTASSSGAQVTPTTAVTSPDDTPSVRVGGTIFLDYTRTIRPQITDANGDRVSPNAFNVARAYINVQGQVNHLVAFRITPDVTRESGAGSSVAGSLTLRLKYGYVQLNLDDWLWRGTYIRAGMIQTPYVEFEDSVYRYRFQGPGLTDREAYLPSADFGVAFRTQSPSGRAEVVAGIFNGEGYSRAEANNQKAFQVRGTLRPFPSPGLKRGLRLTVLWDDDHYVEDSPRRRLVTLTTYEHRHLTAGWSYFDASDQTSLAVAKVDSRGHSIWVIPRLPHGTVLPSAPAGQVRASLEGLIRYDRIDANLDNDSVKDRWILGVAYWPRVMTSSVSSAFLLNYEQVRYRDFAPSRPTEKRLAVHTLITF